MKIKLLFIAITALTVNTITAQTPVEYFGQLSVSGKYIVDKRNEPVSFAGPSLFWSNTDWGGEKFYNADVVNWVANDWNAYIIRAAMGADAAGGYLTNPENKQRIEDVVDAAIEAGIYVIIDWHSHYAENYTSDAVTFFKSMATTYGAYPNVIYEIYNEPLQVSWTNVIKPYATTVIAAIRKIDPDNIIVVGTPSWSQSVDEAANSPISNYKNIAYTLHFYAGTHTQWLRDKATYAMNKNIALMVTEWGTVNADGNGDVATDELALWVQFMKDNKLTNCNWALNDKIEGASALVNGASETGDWTDSDLTESGTVVYDLIKNWEGNYVSIKCIENESNISVKQNSNNILFITAQGQTLNCSLYNLQGKALQSEINNEVEFNTKALPRGIYILKVLKNNALNTFMIEI